MSLTDSNEISYSASKKNESQEKKYYGIDPKRIINNEQFDKFSEILKCKLCFKLLNNPYDCARCGNSFCQECIRRQLENSKSCPYNCEEFTLKNSSFGIINILNTLTFNCENKESGCNKIINYYELKDHDLLCIFANVNCPNINCNKIIKRKNLEYHINHECHSSFFKCDICKADLLRGEFLDHYETCKIISGAFNPGQHLNDHLNKNNLLNSNLLIDSNKLGNNFNLEDKSINSKSINS